MTALPTLIRPIAPREKPVPPLLNGDRLTRAEFERRYHATPDGFKAELVEGVVYVASPVNHRFHSSQQFKLITWLGSYAMVTPGTDGGDNGTIRLDLDNEPQPDAFLMIAPEHGGQAKVDADGYIEGAPELVAEVSASSASYDLHSKLNAYRRNQVREYIVWRTYDNAIDWFILNEGQYDRLAADADGVLRSRIFPGLWLDPAAMLAGDMPRVAGVAQAGLTHADHAEFVQRLQKPKQA